VAPGARTQLHRHAVTEELYHVTSGSGLMTLGDRCFKVGAGDTVAIAPGTPHRIEATGSRAPAHPLLLQPALFARGHRTAGGRVSAGNLFADLPATQEAAERLETLLDRPGLRIERIVSTGQASPPGFWYQQADAEWVVLLAGEALLRFEDESEARRLRAGDWLLIEAMRRHRVEWTTPATPTVWLAVHHAQG
jgi:cupin 2 domain-containing protein